MSHSKSRFFLLTLFCCIAFSAYSEAAETETVFQKLLRISGISATPRQMRGGDAVEPGQIWMVKVGANEPYRVTSESVFHSPVFMPDDAHLLVLKGTELTEISLNGGGQKNLFLIPGVQKVIGFDQSDDDRFLVLLNEDELALISLKTGMREKLIYQPGPEIEAFLSHIKNWNRVYGDTQVFVRKKLKKTIRGRRTLSNVYYTQNGEESNLSRCKESSCSQPSLSHNGEMVVFIKSK